MKIKISAGEGKEKKISEEKKKESLGWDYRDASEELKQSRKGCHSSQRGIKDIIFNWLIC